MPASERVERGLLTVEQMVRRAVEQGDVRVVVIDSLNGYLTGMSDEKSRALQALRGRR
ncbi:MAG TPA: hypothetical protein VFP68_05955 [Burkholderiaceae bacterium]|nr:hypothetical protein [Burkholderiaceae bacterium]